MRIVFFPSDNSQGSGAFRSMVQLCAHLVNDFDHEILIVLSRPGNGEVLLDQENLKYTYVRSFNWIVDNEEKQTIKTNILMFLKLIGNAFACRKIANLLKRNKTDIVHINTTWTYIGSVAAKKANIPFVWHIREFLEEDQNVRLYNRKQGYRLISDAAAIIAISNSIKHKYEELLKDARIYTVLNGINPELFSVDNHVIFQNDTVCISMVGTISESKGQYQLIEAVALLRGKTSQIINVKIVGGGKEEYISQLKNRVKGLGIDDIVKFEGFQKNTNVYYVESDIVCVCSKAEAFGRITVEAMMSGALVIGADCGATSELIEDGKTGLLFQYNNYDDLCEKMLYAISNVDKSRRIAKCGQAYMLHNMTSYENARKVDEIYRQIVANSRASD